MELIDLFYQKPLGNDKSGDSQEDLRGFAQILFRPVVLKHFPRYFKSEGLVRFKNMNLTLGPVSGRTTYAGYLSYNELVEENTLQLHTGIASIRDDWGFVKSNFLYLYDRLLNLNFRHRKTHPQS